MVHTEDG
jgi:hypothetical protein